MLDGQSWQAAAPGRGLKVPNEQCLQYTEPQIGANVPAGQFVQLRESPKEDVPGSHRLHLVAPGSSDISPGAQGSQPLAKTAGKWGKSGCAESPVATRGSLSPVRLQPQPPAQRPIATTSTGMLVRDALPSETGEDCTTPLGALIRPMPSASTSEPTSTPNPGKL
eukprot:scaffold75458_cov45-Prasinocladus_malaysianus.AAC.2